MTTTSIKYSVSIIIPAYNAEELISNCIESCLRQTFQNFEIIIVNDGSTDNTTNVLSNYKRTDDSIVIINKPNAGVNLARKTGVEHATGDYVFFLDSDDTIPLDAIAFLYNKSLGNNADIVAGDVHLYNNDKISSKRFYSNFNLGSGIQFLEYILENQLHYLCGKLIKRSLYTQNNIFIDKDIVIGEDQIQMYQLCMYANNVVSINNIVYNYILNENSVTQKQTEKMVFTKNHEAYAHGIYKLKQKFNFNKTIRQQLNLRIIWALFGAIGTSKQFVFNNKMSIKILYKTIFNAIFSKNSLFFKHYKLLIKSFFYPIFYKITNLFKS